MRLVMDVLFLETLSFRLRHVTVAHCQIAPSREEILRRLLAEVGIELIDYGSFAVQPLPVVRTPDQAPIAVDMINAFSKAYRERAERATASR